MIEGVYHGGDLTTIQIEDPQYIVRKYNGYASWFTGQLDGEVLNNDWTFSNTVTATDVFNGAQINF